MSIAELRAMRFIIVAVLVVALRPDSAFANRRPMGARIAEVASRFVPRLMRTRAAQSKARDARAKVLVVTELANIPASIQRFLGDLAEHIGLPEHISVQSTASFPGVQLTWFLPEGREGRLVIERMTTPRGNIHAVFILATRPGPQKTWLPGGWSSIEAALRRALRDASGERQFFLLDHNGTVRQRFVGKTAETDFDRWRRTGS